MAEKVHAKPKRAARNTRRKTTTREDRPRPELVIITGLSGSGKASALKAFEDLGYYCVDNLPVDLIPRFAELAVQSLETRRTALAVKEANLRSAQQVQGHFQRSGTPMWGSRAEQVWGTASKFSTKQLERGLKLIFEADRDLRSARPDDRTIMESFVVRLCA